MNVRVIVLVAVGVAAAAPAFAHHSFAMFDREKATTVSGTVLAFEPSKSITITRADGTQVTYMINDESQLPTRIAVGRRVTIYPSTVMSGSDPMVRRVVYTTTTKTKTNKHGETKTKTETHHN